MDSFKQCLFVVGFVGRGAGNPPRRTAARRLICSRENYHRFLFKNIYLGAGIEFDGFVTIGLNAWKTCAFENYTQPGCGRGETDEMYVTIESLDY